MITLSQSTKKKLSLPQLAEELRKVSKACKLMGYHRDTFYEVRRAFQIGALRRSWRRSAGPAIHIRIASHPRSKILDYALSFPTHGPQRVSNELRLTGTEMSPGGVRAYATAESFFASLECELLDRHHFKTQAEAKTAVFEYIDGFYNPHRMHSSLGNLSPVNFERRYAAQNELH